MPPLVARDIMSKDVVSLSPGMSIASAADALLHYRIHGAPIVDEADQLIGMVSFTDLSGRAGGTLRDVMTAEAVSVSEDTPVDEIAALMLDQMVRRVPVVTGGRVIGIVSASDIIQVFLNLHEAGPRAAEAKDTETVKISNSAAPPRRSPALKALPGARPRPLARTSGRGRPAPVARTGRGHKAHTTR